MAKAARKFTMKNDSLLQMGGDDEVGAVRVEEGVARDPKTGEVMRALYQTDAKGQAVLGPDGQPVVTRPEVREWKVYQLQELEGEELERYRAQVGPQTGELLQTTNWKQVGAYPTRDEAEAAAEKL